MKQFVKNY